jgi:phosphonate transport system substrate-binding protein
MARSRSSVFIVVLTVSILVGVYCIIDLFGQQALNRLYSPRKWVNLEGRNKVRVPQNFAVSSSGEPQLRVAIAPIMSPEKSRQLYNDLISYMGKALNVTPTVQQRSSYAEINDLLHYGDSDVAFVCSYPFVLGEREYGLKLLVIPRVKGQTTMQSLIIVPAGSSVTSLTDLRGKRFASCDIISITGWVYPAIWLMQHGENPNKFFSEHIICNSHDRALWAVATKFVDGAAVQSRVYERMIEQDPGLAQKVRIIMQSPEFGIAPIVVHPHVAPALQERLRSALVSMHETPEGRKILAGLGIDRYELPDYALYDSVRRYAAICNPGP